MHSTNLTLSKVNFDLKQELVGLKGSSSGHKGGGTVRQSVEKLMKVDPELADEL